MHKKFMIACMAISAFAAFVIAPAASASPVLTSGGVAVPVGTSITGKNTGDTLFTGAFNMACTSVDLTGTVSANTGTAIKGTIPVGGMTITGTGAGGDCTSALGGVKVTVNSEVCLENITKIDEITLDGCLVNGVTQPYTVTLEVTGTGPCKYKAATVKGKYLTNSGATVNMVEQATVKEEGGIFCPSEGKADLDFDLYAKEGATQLTIS
jgi:hypothetical protein